jgi:hypothetical protein
LSPAGLLAEQQGFLFSSIRFSPFPFSRQVELYDAGIRIESQLQKSLGTILRPKA